MCFILKNKGLLNQGSERTKVTKLLFMFIFNNFFLYRSNPSLSNSLSLHSSSGLSQDKIMTSRGYPKVGDKTYNSGLCQTFPLLGITLKGRMWVGINKKSEGNQFTLTTFILKYLARCWDNYLIMISALSKHFSEKYVCTYVFTVLVKGQVLLMTFSAFSSELERIPFLINTD